MKTEKYDVWPILEKIVGENVRLMREYSKLSQEELARRAGLDIQVVKAVESGNLDIDVNMVQALAKGLDITVSMLFDGTDGLYTAEINPSQLETHYGGA